MTRRHAADRRVVDPHENITARSRVKPHSPGTTIGSETPVDDRNVSHNLELIERIRAVPLATSMARRRAICVAPIGMSEIAMDSCVRFVREQEHSGSLG